ncbi:hypothetical protein BKA70DRAFT_1247344 [Coprinopsis sp. MPI-PUGE-AT-0042]|nr:hypothetical protein BKA70DRAFT_1247344 [Coprinopsis sp. MPI-PUGE-AT-0042]
MQNAHDPHSTRHGPYPYWNPCPLSAPGWIHTSTPAQYQPFALPSHLYQPPTAQACPPAYPYPHFASAPTYYPAFVTPFQAPVPLTASYPQAATNPAAASSMSSQAFVPVITYFPPLATISVPCPLRDPSVTPVWPPEQVQASLMNLHDPSIHALSQPLVVPQKFEGGTFPPQPLGGLVPIRIHAQLVLNPIDINDPILQWDIVQHPDISRALSPRRVMLPVAMNSLAVTPGSRNLYITSDWDFLQYWMDPKRWGPVILQQGTDVTVQDLLEAIHAYFQQPLTEGEEEEIKAQAGGREKLKDAWRQRVQDSYEALPAISAQYGYVRSDVLGRFRRWQGLRAVVFANGSWKLYLRLLPGPAPDLVI